MSAKIIKKFYTYLESGDLSKASDIMDESFEFSGAMPEPVGKYEFLAFVASLKKGIPDWEFNLREVQEQGGDLVANIQITGRQSGELTLSGMAPIPATNKKVQLPKEENYFKVKGKKITQMRVQPVEGGGMQGVLSQIGAASQTGQGSDVSTLYRRVFEQGFGKGDLAALDSVIADKIVTHDPNQPFPVNSRDDLKQLISMYRGAFPDMKMSVTLAKSSGNYAVLRWVATGTHSGNLGPLGATGRRVCVEGTEIARFEKGRATEVWTSWNQYGMLAQLGVLPRELTDQIPGDYPCEIPGESAQRTTSH